MTNVEKNNQTKKYNIWWAMNIFGQLGFVIAIPAAGLAYLGALVDKKYHFSPWGVVIGLILALTISSVLVWRMVKKLGK